MEARYLLRVVMGGALLASGCTLQIDPRVFPTTGPNVTPPPPSASPRPTSEPSTKPKRTPDVTNSLVPVTPPLIEYWEPPMPCDVAVGQGLGVSGSVFDEQGVPFEGGVEVRVRNKDHSYSRDVPVENGRYFVYDAPAGERLEVTVVHTDSGEARRRFVTPAVQQGACGQEAYAVLNFGGPQTAEDPLGARYPLPTVESSYVVAAETAILSGTVVDVDGRSIDGGVVTVTSLAEDFPYIGTATTAQGAYVFNNVPEGVPVEVRVEVRGFFARARIATAFAGGKNLVNFGGPSTAQDPQAPQYALAPVPVPAKRRFVDLAGRIRDLDGKAVLRGKVRVRSLLADVPYESSVAIDADGRYACAQVPAGIDVEITIEAEGFEPISRVERLRSKEPADVSFGGGATRTDPDADAYGLVETIDEEG